MAKKKQGMFFKSEKGHDLESLKQIMIEVINHGNGNPAFASCLKKISEKIRESGDKDIRIDELVYGLTPEEERFWFSVEVEYIYNQYGQLGLSDEKLREKDVVLKLLREEKTFKEGLTLFGGQVEEYLSSDNNEKKKELRTLLGLQKKMYSMANKKEMIKAILLGLLALVVAVACIWAIVQVASINLIGVNVALSMGEQKIKEHVSSVLWDGIKSVVPKSFAAEPVGNTNVLNLLKVSVGVNLNTKTLLETAACCVIGIMSLKGVLGAGEQYHRLLRKNKTIVTEYNKILKNLDNKNPGLLHDLFDDNQNLKETVKSKLSQK